MSIVGDVQITETLPELRVREAKLRAAAKARGVTYKIADFGGVRSEADTARILGYRAQDYAAAVRAKPDTAKTPITRWRPINPFGLSLHNWGAAFDVKILSAPPGVDGYKVLADLAPSVGLRAGYYFKRFDGPHHELPITVLQARSLWIRAGGSAGKTSAAVIGLQTVAPVTVVLFLVGAGLGVYAALHPWRDRL